MNSLKISFQLGLREWRRGQWTLILLALILAISAFTAEYFLNDRLKEALNQQAKIMLGGDLVVSSTTPLKIEWKQEAETLKLNYAESWTFQTVLSSADKLHFVSVQAISKNPPESGVVWIDKRLAAQISSDIQIGVAKFNVLEKLDERNEILSGLSLAPRVIMNLQDVPKTQTILPGSQVEYRLILEGNAKQIKSYKQWLLPQLRPNQKLLDVYNQRFLAGDILQNANQYFSLAIMICLIMSGIVLLLGSAQYLEKQQIPMALLRSIGLKQKQLLKIFLWQIFGIGMVTSLIGISLGYGLHILFIEILKKWYVFNLPQTSILPIFIGGFINILLLSVLIFPAFVKLTKVSPILLWRTDKKLSVEFSWFTLLITGLTTIFIFWLLNSNIKFILWFLNILIILVAVFYILLHFVFLLLRKKLFNILRYQTQSALQIIGFSLIIMSVLLIYNIRTDLFSLWQNQLPHEAPNYFAFNISPDQVLDINQSLKNIGAKESGIYPMVRGRLIELNNQPIFDAVSPSQRNHNALHRELNLSWMWILPSDNKIVEGQWWDKNSAGKPWISIEKDLADQLNIHLNDQLTFQVGDQTITGIVKNFRTLNWRSFHPNFYIIFPPGYLDQYPATYITSFYLPSDQQIKLNQFTQQFPNMTLIDVSQLLKQAQELLNQAGKTMQYTFVLTFIAGLLLLGASIQATLSSREYAYRVMRILGASQRYLQRNLFIEMSISGILAGLIAALFATLIGIGIADYLLHINYQFHFIIFIYGILLGFLCLTIPAWIFTRKILLISSITSLQR